MITIDLTGAITNLSLDFQTGKAILTLAINDKQSAISCYDELHDIDKLRIKIDKYRKKRSLDANSYCWVLIGQLSEKLNIPKTEMYRSYIKDVGVYRQVEIDEKAADTLIYSWGLHGVGWVAEKLDYSEHDGFVLINLYYGSSTYNTAQMSRLIDNIVEDCKAQGIDTRTPAELASMIDLWKGDN